MFQNQQPCVRKKACTAPFLRAIGYLAIALGATLAQAATIDVPNPAGPGPHAVIRADYDLGDNAYQIENSPHKSELRAAVYLPRDARGPRPVVVLMHGSHAYCYNEEGVSPEWPCPAGYRPKPSYLGYETSAAALASHGYAVVSVSINGILGQPGESEFVYEDWQMAGLVLAHLDLLARANRGEIGTMAGLTGRLDLERIGLLGHSRGAGGVGRTVLRNAQRENPYGVASLFLLAPAGSDFGGIPDVPMATLLSYCDGATDLAGQEYFDESRHAFPDNVLRSAVLLMGANHNFYNTMWSPGTVGGSDDAGDASFGLGCAPAKRLTAKAQNDLGAAYIAGFFRLTLGGERNFLPLFDGSQAVIRGLPPADARSTASFPAESRFDLRNFDSASDDEDSASPAWRWSASGQASIGNSCGDSLPFVNYYVFSTTLCWPHAKKPGVRQLLLWSPRAVDASAYSHLSLSLARAGGSSSLWMHAWMFPQAGPPQVLRIAGAPALATLPKLSTRLAFDGAPFDVMLPQQVTVPLTGLPPGSLRRLHSLMLSFGPHGGMMTIGDVSLVTPSVGEGKPSRLPATWLEDVELEPASHERELVYKVRLTRRPPHPIALKMQLDGQSKALRIEAGEQEQFVRLKIKAGAAPASCKAKVQEVRGGAFAGKDHARLRINGEADHDVSDCSGFAFAD